jgi:hypothetical protein
MNMQDPKNIKSENLAYIKTLTPPKFNDGDSVIDFMAQIKDYEIKRKKYCYNIILDFVNLWLVPYKIVLKSLLDFKNIRETVIMKDNKHNKRMIKKHSSIIKTQLDIKNAEPFDDCDTDDVPEHEIIVFISLILKKIEYSISRRFVDDRICFTINDSIGKSIKKDSFQY